MSLRDNGFVNYFGSQRFGAGTNIRNHDIGQCYLQHDWKRTVDLILTRFSSDHHDEADACREYLPTHDANTAIKFIPSNNTSEAKHLLQNICKHGDDLFSALEEMPLKHRKMYICSFQSYVW